MSVPLFVMVPGVLLSACGSSGTTLQHLTVMAYQTDSHWTDIIRTRQQLSHSSPVSTKPRQVQRCSCRICGHYLGAIILYSRI